ncbi:MAG TPA: FAD-dependent oxidoreductase [Vicinamibacterales bacterium]|nr:FAD-dependent oxidoreductase [Vicinamibacterales bacterium]
MALLTLPIVEARRETPRNLVVRLGLGDHPFDFRAGEHVLLGDVGGGDRRPYSIASAPVHVARSRALEFLIQVDANDSPGPHLRRLVAGVSLDVEGPAGDFTLPGDPAARSYLFVAGGTGVAPIRSMLWQVLETQPAACVGLVQTARSAEDLSYAAEFRALAGDGRIRLLESVTREAGAWGGMRGRVGAAQLAPLIAGPDTLAFVCGPDSLVEEVPLLLSALGVRETRTEHWAG